MAEYDFIVVGGGPAGCVLASQLAKSTKAPSVLLLEAGGDNAGEGLRYLTERFTTLMQPGMNWGYKTTPQPQLNNQELDYSRGKGLGGSTAINFAAWTIGPKDDYNEWARIVGDDAFNWESARRRFNDIECMNLEVSEKYQRYFKPSSNDHANRGKVNVECPPVWEKGLLDVADAAEEFGFPINQDINSGNPVGIGLFPSTSRDGVRNTAADAFLTDPPANLKVQTYSPVHKIAFEGSKAIGVWVEGDRYYGATKEVVLCSGALNTPKLLKLSGIGPQDELAQHEIPCIKDLRGVGANLQDHFFTSIDMHVKPGIDDRPALFSNPTTLESARQEFQTSRTGPLTSMLHALLIYSLKAPEISSTPEFRALAPDLQAHLLKPAVPHFEMVTHTPPLMPLPQDRSYFSLLIILFNPQSRDGTVKLRSADPEAPPLCDGRFLTHEFDRMLAVHAVRIGMAFLRTPALAKNFEGTVRAPASESEADILEYVSGNCGTDWHMSGTARMGREEDEMSVVDTGFRVKGLQSLRVVDMSVVPFEPNCHTQSVAYQIGAMAAEKLCEEYELN